MVAVASQIDAVNQAADGLLTSRHPRSPQVRQCQQQLNERYGGGRCRGERVMPGQVGDAGASG